MKIVSIGEVVPGSDMFAASIAIDSLEEANYILSFIIENYNSGVKGGVIIDHDFGKSASIYFKSDDSMTRKVLNLVYGKSEADTAPTKKYAGEAKHVKCYGTGDAEKYNITAIVKASGLIDPIRKWLYESIGCYHFEIWQENGLENIVMAQFNTVISAYAYLEYLDDLGIDVCDAVKEFDSHLFRKEAKS